MYTCTTRWVGLYALLFFASAVSAQSTHTVCASGCDFTSIQAAVTAASAGDTIDVGAGTYNENIAVNKNLSLIGAGLATTTIEGISGAGALGAVLVDGTTTGVLIQGFTIVGIDNGNPGIENAALYVRGTHGGLQVLDNEITANGDHGFLAEYGASLTNPTLSGNTFSGQSFVGPNPAGEGFSQQFTLPNVPRQLVTLGNGGGTTGANVVGLAFTNNQVTGTAGGINTSGNEQGNTLATLDAENATITGNTFAGTTTRFGAALRSRRPGGTISGNTFVSTGMGLVTEHMFLQNNTTTIQDIVAANTFDRGAYHDNGSDMSVSVSGGAGRAPGGSTVNVLPGTYEEQVRVDAKDLTIQGAGAGTTTIQAPNSMDACFTTSTDIFGVVCATGDSDLSVDGVTIDGLGRGNGHYRFVGIGWSNSGGAFTNGAVTGIRETPFNGNQHGVAVYAYNDDATSRSINVSNNQIDDFQKNAMALNSATGTPLSVTVDGNTITGVGVTAVTAQNGIQLYGVDVSGTVSNNTISGIAYDNTANPTKYVATSVLNYWASADLTNNDISGAQVGAYWYDGNGTLADNTIDVTTVGNGGMWGIIGTDPPRAVPSPVDVPEGAARPVTSGLTMAGLVVSVEDNTITFSGGDNTSTFGIEADAGYGADDLDFTANGNTVSGFEVGLEIYECQSGCSTGVFTSVSAGGNNLSGNDIALRSNWSTGTVDAPGNFFGDADPSDDVVGTVDYSPWLGFAPGTSPQTWYTDDSIGDAVAAAAAGDAVNVLAGSYTESVSVAKALDLNGAQSGVAVGGRTHGDASESTLTGGIEVTAANVTVDGFSLTNPGGTSAVLINAGGSDATVSNNLVQSVGTTTSNVNVHAIYLFGGPDNVTVTGNALSDLAADGRTVSAISILDSAGSDCSDDAVISDNSIRNVYSTGPIRNWGAYGFIANRCTSNLLVEDNVIDDIEGEWSHGIGLEADSPGATVQGNAVSNLVRHKPQPDAVAVFFQNNPSGASVTVTANSFTGTMDYGVAQHADDLAAYDYIVDAELNWWNAATGPTHASNPSGTGIGSGDDVDFDPWIGKGQTVTVTAANTPIEFDGDGDGDTDVTLTFTTLPPGGGTVTVQYVPTAPTPAPPGTSPDLYLDISSSMEDYSFSVDVVLDVSGIAGFGPDSEVAYLNDAGDYVIIPGTYDAGPPATYSFTTDHFTPFVFFTPLVAPYNLFVSGTADAASVGTIYPNDSWATTAYEPNDWRIAGAIVEVYIVPEETSTFGAADLTLSWDEDVLTYVGVDRTGGLFDNANSVFQVNTLGSTNSVRINASRLDNTNLNVSGVGGGDQFIAKLEFTMAAPGYSEIDFASMDLRAYDGLGGQSNVLSIANGGGVKAYLGDVATTGDESTGDGEVDFEDLVLFSGAYWSGVPGFPGGSASYKVKYDVGPTSDGTVFAVPTEDGAIEFEDLVIFSISYGLSQADAYPLWQNEPPVVVAAKDQPTEPVEVSAGEARVVGSVVHVPIRVGSLDDLRALSIEAGLNGSFEVVGAAAADLIPSDVPSLAVARASASGVTLDAAVFSLEGVSGEGAVAELILRPLSGSAASYAGRTDLLQFAEADLRTSRNVSIPTSFGVVVANEGDAPVELTLGQSMPNPTTGRAEIRFGLPTAGATSLVVYDALGRAVVTLVEDELPAGYHTVALDAQSFPSGTYIYVLRAGGRSLTGRALVVR